MPDIPNDTTEPKSAPELPSSRKVTTSETSLTEGTSGQTEDSQMQTRSQDEIVVKPANLDTPETDAAIDAIVAQEADEVLAAQDAGLEAARVEADGAVTEPKKHGHPIFWFFITLLVVIALIAGYVLTNPGLELPFSV